MKKKLLTLLVLTSSMTFSYAQTDLMDSGSTNQDDLSQMSDDQLLNEANQTSEAATESETETETESPLAKKNGTVPEYELLKPKNKPPKVVSEKPRQTDMYIQEAQKFKLNDNLKPLTLNDVIEQGLRENYDHQIRVQSQFLNQLTFEGQKDAFWMPRLKLELNTDPHVLGTIHSSSRTPSPKNSSSPSGTFGLVLGDYTIFNWGKDYALYLNKKDSYESSKSELREDTRNLKQNLIIEFFRLLKEKNVEKIWQDNLRQTSFVYRLNKEKITVGKTTRQDYYQARSDYLKSQNSFHQSKIVTDQTDESLAYMITDPIGSKYILSEQLKYKEVNITSEEILELARKNAPRILFSRTGARNSARDYDVALKENMPLPKISVNLGAYTHQFGPTDNELRYRTYNNGGDVEVVATINTTWDLTGEDGLFNQRKLAKARTRMEIANQTLEKNSHLTESEVRKYYKTILSLQNQINIIEARLVSIQRTFDTILENYLAGRAKYYDYSLALEDLTQTKIYSEELKFQHLYYKIQMAQIAGIEDFPGEAFEQLAEKVKR